MEATFFSHTTGTETSRGYKYYVNTGFKDPVSGYIYASEKDSFSTPEAAEAYSKAQAKKKLKEETVSGPELSKLTDNKKAKSVVQYSMVETGGKS